MTTEARGSAIWSYVVSDTSNTLVTNGAPFVTSDHSLLLLLLLLL